MTVRKLISLLHKMPQNAFVVWSDHDQGDGDMNSYVGTVQEARPELIEARLAIGDIKPGTKLVELRW
jgi:hypothetical protein